MKEGDDIDDRYRVVSVQSQGARVQSVTVELNSDELGDVIQSERGGILLKLVAIR